MTAEIVPTEMDDFFVGVNQQSLQMRLQEFVAHAKGLQVTNEPSFKRITSLYADAKDWEKKMEFTRKNANAPDQARINARNDKARELMAPLKEIQQIAKAKCDAYHRLLEQKKLDEQANADAAVDLLGLEETVAVAPVDTSIRGDGAIAFIRTVRKFRIVDESKIPDKYFVVDQELIDQDIKLGLAEIPGVEIYEEKITQLKTR